MKYERDPIFLSAIFGRNKHKVTDRKIKGLRGSPPEYIMKAIGRFFMIPASNNG